MRNQDNCPYSPKDSYYANLAKSSLFANDLMSTVQPQGKAPIVKPAGDYIKGYDTFKVEDTPKFSICRAE